jgi:hypothetical protein
MRLVSHILNALVVPALVGGIATLAFVAMSAEHPWSAPANAPADGEIATLNPEWHRP